jgi:outer membrane immunogenic protein
MKKILAAVVAAGLLPVCVAGASPMTDITPGKVQIDANVTVGSSIKGKRDGHTVDFDGDTRYRAGATVGIGDNLALDYVYSAHEGDDDASVQSHQVNLVYQFNPYLYGFGGYVRNRADHRDYTDNTNGFQVGAIGRLPLTDRLTGWGKVGYGNTITQYEVGMGYAITDNWEANVSYNDSKYKDFSGDTDVKTHGVNVGVSYKF